MVNRVDSRILKTQWIVDQLWNLVWIPDCTCLDVGILGPKPNLDHRSFFSLGQYVNEFIQIISFFEQSSFKLRYETVIGVVLCYSYDTCCLLYYLYEINNGIQIYQFTFLPSALNFYTCVSVCGCGVGLLNKNIGGWTDLVKKMHGSADSPPTSLLAFHFFSVMFIIKMQKDKVLWSKLFFFVSNFAQFFLVVPD